MSTTDANIATIQSLYVAFTRSDGPAILGTFAPDGWFESVGDPALLPFAGRHHGHEGIASFLATLTLTMDFLTFEPRYFKAFDDTVMVEGEETVRLKSTGRTTTIRWLHVFTLAGGRITSGTDWLDTARLLAAHRGL